MTLAVFDQATFFQVIRDLGFPIAVGGILVWHILRLNSLLTRQNNSLITQLSKLQADVQQNAKLVEQNERLVQAIQEREAQSFKLVETMLSVRLSTEERVEELDSPKGRK